MASGTVMRLQLGRELKRLREQANKKVEDVVAAQICSASKLWRIETARSSGPVKVSDVIALCRLYGVDSDVTDALAQLARGTGQQGWWTGMSLPPWLDLLIGLEEAASHVCMVASTLLPGLVQTPAYQHALATQAIPPVNGPQHLEQRIQVRQRRQQALTHREPPLRLTAVLDAAALSRQVGGPTVMADQLRHLHSLNALDNVELRVLPAASGAYSAAGKMFTILYFTDATLAPTVYFETMVDGLYVEHRTALEVYEAAFRQAYQMSCPIRADQP